MNKDEKFPEDNRNKNTSPTDIKGKDINEANQTNSGAGGGDVKEGSNNPSENNKKNKNDNNNQLDPMGTEVMQEDEYQQEKHGKNPAEDQENTKNKPTNNNTSEKQDG